jgi:hypothetical protein
VKKPRRKAPGPPRPLRSSLSVPPRTSGTRTTTPRNPQVGRGSLPNPLRPHVAAADRLQSWHTPYSLIFQQEVRKRFPPDAADAIFRTIQGALAPATKSTYGAGILRFTQYCDEMRIPESDRMPAPFILLVAFISAHVGKVSGRTVKAWLSGLKAWHDTWHAPWNGDDRWVQMARTTANKEGASFRKRQRSPATVEHLRALLDTLDISTPPHAAVWAIACSAFWGCRRLGELTIKSRGSFDPMFHATRATSTVFRTNADGSSFVSIHLPWTKTTREEGGTLLLTGRDDALCPIRAFRNHLSVNSGVPADAPLFASQNLDGTWSPPLKHIFVAECKRVWATRPLAIVDGHSWRIGGTTELLMAGVSPEIVATLGGWTSLAFLLYWRRIEEILPMNIAKAYKKKRIQELAVELENFRVRSNIPKVLPVVD